ncbi:MAG: RyR domain-containing protein [Acidobacteria bacterium]|nr:RyR domain-containing protein [Acidobacteriota bacterium]
MPLVFWDEFDSGGLRWLKEFLAPMQDAEFRSQGLSFPFGKAIFVFAGGTAHTFDQFDRTGAAGDAGASFRTVKGPDFVSRLRGYVNIKGPNPTGGGGPNHDIAHLIRRAIIFRSCLERLFPQLIDSKGTASVAAGVVNAFLRVETYIHGARSLDSLISMSSLTDASFFGVADLPSADLIRLHATADFIEHARAGELEAPVVEALAAETHESWRRQRVKDGWSYGETRVEADRKHPLLRPYCELPEGDKESSRIAARLTAAKLAGLGLRIVSRGAVSAAAPRQLTDEEIATMMRFEHDLWLRERLLRGYEYADCSNDRLWLHRDILPFERVPPEDQDLDRALAESVVATLWRCGHVLVARD